MNSQTPQPQDVSSTGEAEVRTLYQQLLECWNRRRADAMAALFAENGNIVGFDGSPLNGRAEIEPAMRQIFADHPTSAYVARVREVRFLTPEVALLRAAAGMVPPGPALTAGHGRAGTMEDPPPGKHDLNPAVNAIQSLVAARRDGRWQVELFQNTPAQFHGRPEMAQQLTEELRQLLSTA